METPYAAVPRPRSFRIDRNAVAPFHKGFQMGDYFVDGIGDRHKFRRMDDGSVERVVPCPSVGEKNHFRREDELACQVEMRLMVCDDEFGFVEIHIIVHLIGE